MIPFNKPYVPDASKKYALDVLDSNHQQGDGPFTNLASKLISELVGGGHVLLTPSCTHALEMASMLAGIGPGDEVILPSYTFTSAATAITQFGATPVFVDIDPKTKGIDVNQVAAAITKQTVAISWVNYAGVAPDIEALKSIATENNLLLIEDNAHGLGGTYRGLPLGSFGDFATQSFHATKNIQCGEGGALIINNKSFVDRAEIIREKGTNRSQFMRGEVAKYRWLDKGSSYLLPEILAGMLLGQLENFSEIQKNRESSYTRYESGVREYLNCQEVNLPVSETAKVAHMFYLLYENADKAQEVASFLRLNGVTASFHYQPLGSSPAGLKFGRIFDDEKNSRKISSGLLRLPLWHNLPEDSIHHVTKLLKTI